MFQFKLKEKISMLQRLICQICNYIYIIYLTDKTRGKNTFNFYRKKKKKKQTNIGYSFGCNHINMGIKVKVHIVCVIILSLPLWKCRKEEKQTKQKKPVVQAAAVVGPQPRSGGN